LISERAAFRNKRNARRLELRHAHVDGDAAIGFELRHDHARLRADANLSLLREPVFAHEAHEAARAVAALLDLAAVALAAEQVGGAQKVLEMAVEYAKVRVQFGRPIGSFQAIKHKCADMLLEVESAKSAAYYAGWAAADDSDELPVVASLAKAYCSDAYFHAAAENIQIHGGIGFTWEHDAHLYYRRALTIRALLGSSAEWADAVAGLALRGISRPMDIDLPEESEALRAEIRASLSERHRAVLVMKVLGGAG